MNDYCGFANIVAVHKFRNMGSPNTLYPCVFAFREVESWSFVLMESSPFHEFHGMRFFVHSTWDYAVPRYDNRIGRKAVWSLTGMLGRGGYFANEYDHKLPGIVISNFPDDWQTAKEQAAY